MRSRWRIHFSILLALGALSAALIAPTLFDLKEESPFPFKSKINLGLDLQGGLYMILGIDFQEVYRDEVAGYASKIVSYLKDEEIASRMGQADVSTPSDPRHSVEIENDADRQRAKEEIRRIFGPLIRLTGEGTNRLEYALSESSKETIEGQSVSKSIEVIRNRIDEFGVTEPIIVSQGEDRIVVQLPGVKDIERAKNLIGQTAKLEFHLVGDHDVPLGVWMDRVRQAGIVYERGDRFSKYVEEVNTFLKDDLPDGHRLAFQRLSDRFTDDAEDSIPMLIEETSRIDGEMLQDARVQIDPQRNQPYVSLDLTGEGAEIFEEITGDNVGRLLAIVLDGNIYSAPRLQERISGGRAQITLGGGGFNKMMREASDLALVLRAGALPVELHFLEQRTVGPSLGSDSIAKTRFAGLVGALLVFLFILFYYRTAGLIATAVLSLNILFVLACLVAFGATLTLPGIAGIALTIGMAVDANIIIYERIREEVGRGTGNYKAVENGFDQAFWTILDANTTTALAGLCLLNFGTGPIRGFAVTLLIGIVSTLYTSYFAGRLLFEFYMNRVEGRRLSI